ncbi:MAG: hypothetical protein ABJH98_10415 [Reichenbachiella sp.]|uniref:hypothetical protein n=1 Tax=Reichenbachiella sp. TaxID=2184521 RepID=UPI003297A25F
MQQQTRLIFLFLFLWLAQRAQGQSDGKRAENTILKINKDKSPYSSNQNKWLEKNGFDVKGYSWTNVELNDQLDHAIVNRGAAYALLSLSLVGVAAGISNVYQDPDKFFLLAVSVPVTAVSALQFSKARRKIKEIEWARRSQEIQFDNELTFPPLNLYSDKTNTWMMKRGLDVSDYYWDNPDINLGIERAVKARSMSKLWSAIAMTGAAFGLKHILSDGSESGIQAYGLLVGVSSIISLAKSNRAKEELLLVSEMKQKIDESRKKALEKDSVVVNNLSNHEEQNENTINSMQTHTVFRSPYERSQNSWISKNGFELSGYNWNDLEINLNLEKAVKQRSSARILVGASIASLFLGSVFNLAHALNEDPDKSDRKPGTGFFIATGGMLTGSIIISQSGRNKVEKAEQLRKSLKSKYPKVQSSDLD